MSAHDMERIMNIIIVGCGRVGMTLTKQLSSEGHDVTIIDEDGARVQAVSADCDVMGVIGNGASHSVLSDAGIEQADLLIAVTDSDELNLLCCLLARKAGGCSAIARVRNPIYSKEADYIRKELGLSMIINPELAAAAEIARVLRFPNAIEINPFVKGKVELLKFRIEPGSLLDGLALMDFHSSVHSDVLICAVERGNEVIIPDGRFVLKGKDRVSIIATPMNAASCFKRAGMDKHRVNDAMLIGGGRIAFYLAKLLLDMGIQVKIIEQKRERCEELCVLLPKAMIIHGDGTDKPTLIEEGLERTDAFVTLTGLDEENILLSLFAKSRSQAKLVTKVKHINFNEVINELDLDTVIYPQDITAESILRYVRAKQNTRGNNIETLYKIIEDKAEALEFKIQDTGAVTGVSLEKLPIRKNILIGCIYRNGEVIIPKGKDCLLPGDSVIIVTTNNRLNDISDILKDA